MKLINSKILKIRKSGITRKARILFLLCFSSFLYFISKAADAEKEDEHRGPHITFALIICSAGEGERANGPKIVSDITRQLTQTEVLMKSAVALSSTILRFVFLVDTDSLFDDILRRVSSWPQKYRARLILEKRPVIYPEGAEHLRAFFRICATARLFVPSMTSDLDSVIFIDTDFIFMRPPEELWAHFASFNDHQIVGMAPCLNHYNTRINKVPFYGKTGLNAGLLMLNNTRLKDFPGGWQETCIAREKQYRNRIILGDQDILNIIFSEMPNYLYKLDCRWNYRMFLCSQRKKLCPEATENGASLIHGNALTFVTNTETTFKAIFEKWNEYTLGDPLILLLEEIKSELEWIKSINPTSKCARKSNIDQILTNGLLRYIDADEML